MKRLTWRNDDGVAMWKCGENSGYRPGMMDEVAAERLDRLAAYEDAEEQGLLLRLSCQDFYSKAGDLLYLIDDGEICEVVHCGAQIDTDGKVFAQVYADEKIFPYREGIAGIDTDPMDWCCNEKTIYPEDFGKTVFLTREEAEAALAKEV